MTTNADSARFFSRVLLIPFHACWEWSGAKNENGYSRIRFEKKDTYAHRASYRIHKGAIPEGTEIDHLCRNRGCVNPHHLEAVTHRSNQYRSPLNIMTRLAAKTECLRGHPFSEENTGYDRNRWGGLGRRCRTCDREKKSVTRNRLRSPGRGAQ